MIDLSTTTIQQLKDAIALIESAKKAGISVESAPSAPSAGERIMVRGVAISKENLSGLSWDSAGDLRVYFMDGEGHLDWEYTSSPNTQERLFAIAGYRPSNPWEDDEV